MYFLECALNTIWPVDVVVVLATLLHAIESSENILYDDKNVYGFGHKIDQSISYVCFIEVLFDENTIFFNNTEVYLITTWQTFENASE